jgi:RNA polymerase sigma-70 factor (ECF subfamily)
MSARHSTDAELIGRARGGDRVAQQELWRAHRRWVAAIILAHRPRSAELEDLLQDVAVRFIDKVHTLRDNGAFRPWLRQVALNVCRGAARSTRSMLRLGRPRGTDVDEPGRWGRVDEPAVEPPSLVESRDAADRLLAQALSLPLAYREPLLLRCLRSLSYQEIGAVLDLPVTTVETRLARARRMLREELAEPDAEKRARRSSRSRPSPASPPAGGGS